jgi:hypothetical protein
MASRYRRGSAFTTALVGWGFSFLGYLLSPTWLLSCHLTGDLKCELYPYWITLLEPGILL